jgi:hypothetical protein
VPEKKPEVWKGGPETKALEYGRIDRHYIPLEGMETRNEALKIRKKNVVPEKKPEVWKGGPETKALEYGRIDRHYIPLEGMEIDFLLSSIPFQYIILCLPGLHHHHAYP